MWHHGLQYVLARIQFALFLVPADCEANSIRPKGDRRLKSCHLIPANFLWLSCRGLHLKLCLSDLGQQRDLVSATRGEVPIS